jgi:hypothetical protein
MNSKVCVCLFDEFVRMSGVDLEFSKAISMDHSLYGYAYALGSGILAALASSFAKLTMECEQFQKMLFLWIPNIESNLIYQNWGVYGIRAVALIGAILSNFYMWMWFTRALGYSSSSVQALVTNTAANFIVTVRENNRIISSKKNNPLIRMMDGVPYYPFAFFIRPC